ncbi:MAG TPA: HXXEE domain-containing protein [Ignavibacteriaceae bacterium]|nr:HXXEE domain-containing protein [Ignavibacteriaceae bacterium]
MGKREKINGMLFTAAVITFNFLYMGKAVILLNIGIIISLLVWLNYKKEYNRKLIAFYIIGIVFHITHVLEEYKGEFYKILPSFFNATPWTANQFLIFNFIWLVIFVLAAIGAFNKFKLSYLVVWIFIIVGSIGNGIFHLGSSLMLGEYFPGSISAFFLFIAGILMVQNLTSSSIKINKLNKIRII